MTVAHIVGPNGHSFHFNIILDVPSSTAIDELWTQLLLPHPHTVNKVIHSPTDKNLAYVLIQYSIPAFLQPLMLGWHSSGTLTKIEKIDGKN